MIGTDDRLALAVSIALEAGALARSWFGRRGELAVERKGPQDWVSRADREVEALIRARLAAAVPDDGFLGEESGGAVAERFWAVDPIDGTTNFLRGIPLYAVSIAYVERGQTEVGVVYAPSLHRSWSAVRGGGTRVDGTPAAVSACARVDEAVIGLGYSLRAPSERVADAFRDLMIQRADLRRLGSAAIALAFVAEGALDAFFELHLSPWDALAGLLLVREAGGHTNDFSGGEGLSHGNPVLACAPGLTAALAPIVELAPP